MDLSIFIFLLIPLRSQETFAEHYSSQSGSISAIEPSKLSVLESISAILFSSRAFFLSLIPSLFNLPSSLDLVFAREAFLSLIFSFSYRRVVTLNRADYLVSFQTSYTYNYCYQKNNYGIPKLQRIIFANKEKNIFFFICQHCHC